MIEYPAIITKEGKFTLAEFPDLPGCQTFVEGDESIITQATNALNGWLLSNVSRTISPPLPGTISIGEDATVIRVKVTPSLTKKIQLLWESEYHD